MSEQREAIEATYATGETVSDLATVQSQPCYRPVHCRLSLQRPHAAGGQSC
jgi:hypothetical protein